MAKKIDNIELIIEKVKVNTPIYLSIESGVFQVRLDERIALLLGVDKIIQGKDLSEVRAVVLNAYNKYIENTAQVEMVICINYKATSYYSVSDKPQFKGVSFADEPSSLSFDFKVYGRKTFGNREDAVYYQTQRGQGTVYHNESHLSDPNTFYLSKQCHVEPKGTMVPFSEVGYQKLLNAKEGMKQLSSLIHSFVDQDVKMIGEQLNSESFKLLS